MSFQPGAVLYTQGFGSRPEGVEVPVIQTRAPTTSDINYPQGKKWIDGVANASYELTSLFTSNGVTSATWTNSGGGAQTLTSLTVNGNITLGNAGNKLLTTSIATTTTAGANSFGTVTLVGGTATISTTAVTASSKIILTRQTVGSTGAAALGQLSVGTIVAGTSFVINAWSVASATALATTDVSNIFWMIVN